MKALRTFSLVLLLLVFGMNEGGAASVRGFTIARLKYRGGGDWYTGPTAIPNLLAGLKARAPVAVLSEEEPRVSLTSENLFDYPMLFMTGHGKVEFTEAEATALRKYLVNGGFLWADDDYGMDKYFRKEIKKVFPEKDLVELPFDHDIYHCFYDFPRGLPKIHEHDGKPPQGLGIYHRGRLVVLYTYETDIGDGLEDPEVHKDPPEKREAALKMAINIAWYVLTH